MFVEWNSLSPHKKGAVNELVAATWLLRQGYQVFRNVTPDGSIDIVAIKDDECLKIDVKAPIIHKGVYRLNNKEYKKQSQSGTKILLVTPQGDCLWAE